jgi:hypothetical protein
MSLWKSKKVYSRLSKQTTKMKMKMKNRKWESPWKENRVPNKDSKWLVIIIVKVK